MDPRKSEFLVYEENPQTNFFCMFRLWFSFKNSRHINVLLVCIFENAQKKLLTSKTQFWPFLAVNSGFLCVFKNTDQSNISASIVFKAKTKENICLRFLLQNSKMPFLGGQLIFFLIFCSFSFQNSRHTNVVLINIFFNVLKKLMTVKNGQNGVFDG